MPTPTFTVNFDLDSASGTYKYFNLLATTVWDAPYAIADTVGYWEVTYPDGTIRTGNFPDPDESGATVNFDTLLIPTVTGGGFQVGVYKFQLFQQWDNGVDPAEEFESAITTFSFDPAAGVFDNCTGLLKKPTGLLEVNCFTQVLTWKDTTNYGSPTTINRELYLAYFDGDGAAVTPGHVNAVTLTYNFTWVNVAYTFYINNLVTYVTGNVTVTIRVMLTYGYTITCDYNLCNLINCYIAYIDAFQKRANKLGGANLMPETDLSDYTWLTSTVQALYLVIGCSGKQSKAMSYYDQIQDFLEVKVPGCDCGCGCEDSTTPTQITPYNPATPTTYTFSGIQGITVTVDEDNHVVVKMNDAFYADLVALLASDPITEITSDDESVTIAGGNDLSVRNHMSVVFDINPTAWPVVVTQTNFNRSGNRYKVDIEINEVKDLVGTVPSNLVDYKANNFIMRIHDFLTTAIDPSNDVIDKIDLHTVQIQMIGAEGTNNPNYPAEVETEIIYKDDTGFYFRIIDRADGLPISGDRALNDIANIRMTLKINY